MRTSPARRLFAATAAPLVAVVISFFAFGGIASAHVVTSITADCYVVTVHFSDFPDRGVMVLIAADVNGQTISDDVLVTSATTAAQLDISAATAALVDTQAHIDVDVTWNYLGPQHVHESLTETCGTPTTTTSTTPTTVVPTQTQTTSSPPVTTAVVPVTTGPPASPTTTTAQQTTTSVQVLGATTIPTTTPARVTTTLPGAVTLPKTGTDSAFPLMFALSCLVAGTLLITRHRHTWSR